MHAIHAYHVLDMHACISLTQPTTTKPAHHLERKNSPAFSHLRQNSAQCNRSREPGRHDYPTSVDGATSCLGAVFATSFSANPVLFLLSCRPASPRAGLLRAMPRTRNSPYRPLGFIIDCKTLCNITSPYYLVKQQSPTIF
ncbi:hypothetical protein CGRA01v4_02335 [Colletotrichum graminicola]|nr:hypothetical protein CGRA01v4_02335 [Colletotrichum graminicola]